MSRSSDDRTAAGQVRSGTADPQSREDVFSAPSGEEEAPACTEIRKEDLCMCALPVPRAEVAHGDGRPDADSCVRNQAVRQAQQQAWARHFACHDMLTGLPRRTVLAERLEDNLDRAGRKGRHVALLLIELDGLEGVRSRWGWSAADAVLQEVAQALARSVRDSDMVCRCSNDRFSVILSDLDAPGVATVVAERIRSVVGSLSPAEIGDDRLVARIGLAVSSREGDEAPAMMRRAELAASGKETGDQELA